MSLPKTAGRVRFSDEELKHQELFRRIEGMIAEGMPDGYRFVPQPNEVAAVVLARYLAAPLRQLTLAGRRVLILGCGAGLEALVLAKLGAVVAYGNFLTVAVNFIILAFIIFLMVKQINRIKRQQRFIRLSLERAV